MDVWKSRYFLGESVKITSDDVMDADDGEDEACIDYVFAPAGLYPLPMARNTKSSHKNKIKTKFNFVGKFIGKENFYFNISPPDDYCTEIVMKG